MALILHAAWLTMTVLRLSGVAVVIAGVAVFGVYFITGNARAARRGDGGVPRSSWLGAGPRKGMRIVLVGAIMLSGAFIISLFMPRG